MAVGDLREEVGGVGRLEVGELRLESEVGGLRELRVMRSLHSVGL